MNKWELFALQVFAVVCSYLVLSITGVSALQVAIFTSSSEELSATMLDFSEFISSEFIDTYQQNYQYMEIKFSSTNPSYDIKKIYLYRCKALNPYECIENGIEPVISVNEGTGSIVFDETYRWDDISSDSVGTFLTFAKLDVLGKEVWVASWDKITKTGIKTFYHETQTADKLDVYLNEGVAGQTVKDYIENYNAVPSDSVNHSITETVAGSSVSNVYDLAGNDIEMDPSGTTVPVFHANDIEDNTFTGSLRTWDFVFAGDGKIASPVTFYSTEAGPPTTGGASVIADDWSPQVVKCGSDDIISVRLSVGNASSIGNYQSYYYKIDGVKSSEGSIICTIDTQNASADTYYYDCTIPVVDFPICNGPGTSTISINFNYLGGVRLSGSFPITLQPATPKLVVNSLIPMPFDCGIDTELTAQIKVNDPMIDSPEKYYTFDGTTFHDLDCTSSGSIYTCTIDSDDICSLLQENLEATFKFAYGEVEVLAEPAQVLVTFPPPNMAIDTVTPQTVTAGETTDVSVLLHVNYPDTLTFQEDDFNFNYLNKGFSAASCALESSYSNVKYYKCTVSLDIPDTSDGVNSLSFRLDGFMEGSPKQLTANTFFEILPPPPDPAFTITSVSSPVECVTDDFVTVKMKAENIGLDMVSNYKYTIDSSNYVDSTCTESSSVITCTIPVDELCGTMKNVVTMTYSVDDTYYSNAQKVYLKIPEPNMQVYAIQPDTLSAGEINSVNIKLFLQNPSSLADNPSFLYSYGTNYDETMTCTKVSSTANRDFYECANTQFDISEDFSGTSLSVLFSIEGTLISFPMMLNVADIGTTKPWLEIVSTTPARIEVEAGNQTDVGMYVTVHNAMAAGLSHQATVIPNTMISSGTCTEADVEYDFNCDISIRMPATAESGPNAVTLTLRMSGDKTYDISNITNVFVASDETQIDIQSISPDMIYCGGQTQQNQDTIRISATSKTAKEFDITEEVLSFNGRSIPGSSRYCTAKGQAITCNIPTDKFMAAVECDKGDLAPGEGTRYFKFDMTLLISSGGESEMISGYDDIGVVARPLEPYIEFSDNDIVNGGLQSPINCLLGQSIKLGDSGYVRIMYADLLHPEPKEDDIAWSFRLDAQDDQGKLTKGMGVSPTGNSTICKLIDSQKVGVHRIEDYQCSLYTNTNLFQRCEYGEGQIILTATSSGKKAEGIIDTMIVRDDSKYQIDFDILSSPEKSIDCQVQGYGKGAKCSLASSSSQNLTIRLYNANPNVELTDATLYDFDVLLSKSGVVEPRTLGNCRKVAKEGHKYICPFQIGPTIKLPDTVNVTKDPDQTFDPILLGQINMTVYVKYADGLAKKTISKLDGTMTIQPKKSSAMINAEKMKEKMMKSFDKFKDIFKILVLVLSFCGTCSGGNALIDGIKSGASKAVDNSNKNTQPSVIVSDECYNDPCFGLCVAKKTSQECAKECKCAEETTSTSDATKSTFWTKAGNAVGKIATIIAKVLAAYGIFYLAKKVWNMDIGGDQDEEKNALTENLEKGIKWGFMTCVLPRLVGELGGWIAPEGKVEDTFDKVSSIGTGMASLCNKVMTLMPMVMAFIQFYISYLNFEMCMEMVQNQVEATAMSASSYSGSANDPLAEARQAQASAQAGVQMMNSMMSCFNNLMKAMNQVTRTMVMANSVFGSSGTFSVKFYHGGKDVTSIRDIKGPGELKVVAKNVCGNGVNPEIKITGVPKNDNGCSNVCTVDCNYNMPIYNTGVQYTNQNRNRDLECRIPSTDQCSTGTIGITIKAKGNINKNFKYTEKAAN